MKYSLTRFVLEMYGFMPPNGQRQPTMVKARCLCAQKVFELVICQGRLPVGDGWRYRSWERPFHMSRFDRGGALLVGSWKLMAFKCNRVQMKMVGISCHGNPKEQRGNEMIIATSVTKDHRECNDAKSTLFGRNDDWLEPIQTMNEIHNKGHGWRKQETLKQQHWIIGKKSGRRNGDGSKERLRRKTTPVSTGPSSLSCYTKHDRYSSTEPCSCRRKGGLLGLKENAFVS